MAKKIKKSSLDRSLVNHGSPGKNPSEYSKSKEDFGSIKFEDSKSSIDSKKTINTSRLVDIQNGLTNINTRRNKVKPLTSQMVKRNFETTDNERESPLMGNFLTSSSNMII